VTVLANKEDYRPIVTRINVLTTGGETVNIVGTYKRRKVDVFVEAEKRKDASCIRVPLHVFDNYQAHFLLRSLVNTRIGYCTSICAVHIVRRILVNPTLKVEAKEVVDVPAGQYVCWRISSKKELKNGVQQYIFFSEQEPHPMVKNIKGPQVIELVDYARP
jgi:hypothetical protein